MPIYLFMYLYKTLHNYEDKTQFQSFPITIRADRNKCLFLLFCVFVSLFSVCIVFLCELPLCRCCCLHTTTHLYILNVFSCHPVTHTMLDCCICQQNTEPSFLIHLSFLPHKNRWYFYYPNAVGTEVFANLSL